MILSAKNDDLRRWWCGNSYLHQAALDGVKEISIFNRKDDFTLMQKNSRKINSKTDCKAQLFDIEDHEQLRKEIAESVIFTNATGVGMKPFEGETLLPNADMLRPELIVSMLSINQPKLDCLKSPKNKAVKHLTA